MSMLRKCTEYLEAGFLKANTIYAVWRFSKQGISLLTCRPLAHLRKRLLIAGRPCCS